MHRFDRRQPRRDQTVQDIAGQVEMRPAAGAFDEEPLGPRLLRGEAPAEVLVDLVGELRDARADRGGDAAALSAEPLHRLQDRKSTRLNSSHVAISYAV